MREMLKRFSFVFWLLIAICVTGVSLYFLISTDDDSQILNGQMSGLLDGVRTREPSERLQLFLEPNQTATPLPTATNTQAPIVVLAKSQPTPVPTLPPLVVTFESASVATSVYEVTPPESMVSIAELTSVSAEVATLITMEADEVEPTLPPATVQAPLPTLPPATAQPTAVSWPTVTAQPTVVSWPTATPELVATQDSTEKDDNDATPQPIESEVSPTVEPTETAESESDSHDENEHSEEQDADERSEDKDDDDDSEDEENEASESDEQDENDDDVKDDEQDEDD